MATRLVKITDVEEAMLLWHARLLLYRNYGLYGDECNCQLWQDRFGPHSGQGGLSPEMFARRTDPTTSPLEDRAWVRIEE